MLVYCTKKIYSKIVSAPLKVSNIMIKTWLAYLKKQFSSGYLYNVPLFPNFISKWSKSEEFLFLMRDLPVFHFFQNYSNFFQPPFRKLSGKSSPIHDDYDDNDENHNSHNLANFQP